MDRRDFLKTTASTTAVAGLAIGLSDVVDADEEFRIEDREGLEEFLYTRIKGNRYINNGVAFKTEEINDEGKMAMAKQIADSLESVYVYKKSEDRPKDFIPAEEIESLPSSEDMYPITEDHELIQSD